MNTIFNDVINNIEITIAPDKAARICDSATSCESILDNAVGSIANILSMVADDGMPCDTIVCEVSYAVFNLNALRGIFKDISEQAKVIMDKAEVAK